MRAIIKLQDLKSPCGTPRGMYRLLAAIPNMEGRTLSGNACPSFHKPFFITQSSDIPYHTDSAGYFATFTEQLRFQGITNLEFV